MEAPADTVRPSRTAVPHRSDIADLLRFYAEAGVDTALDEVPRDRLAPPTAAPSTRILDRRAGPADTAWQGEEPAPFDRAPPAASAMPRAAVPDEAQAALAREAARSAASLDELYRTLAAFEGCNLRFTAKNLVFADGNPAAPLMLVGEAPGRDEDLEGLPFVGRSGQLLDRMLAAIGIDRRSAYIANVIPWRPPGNRTPTPHETEICRPFVERQIELAAPRVLVALGGPSAKLLLGTAEGILRLRGGWRVHRTAAGREIPTMPTLHPAYLLRNPAHKKLAWRDFLEIKAKLREFA
ncbi:MAG: uracil-DNA glycosylase [Mesorhizobium sp.]